MIGAYQEILGNMHNLFGDTAALDVYVGENNQVRYLESEEGDSVADMLQYVKLDPKILLERFRDQVKVSDLDEEEQKPLPKSSRAVCTVIRIWKTNSLESE